MKTPEWIKLSIAFVLLTCSFYIGIIALMANNGWGLLISFAIWLLVSGMIFVPTFVDAEDGEKHA